MPRGRGITPEGEAAQRAVGIAQLRASGPDGPDRMEDGARSAEVGPTVLAMEEIEAAVSGCGPWRVGARPGRREREQRGRGQCEGVGSARALVMQEKRFPHPRSYPPHVFTA